MLDLGLDVLLNIGGDEGLVGGGVGAVAGGVGGGLRAGRPDEVVSADTHTVADGLADFGVGSGVGEGALGGLNRAPLHVVAGSDAVEVHGEQLGVGSGQVGRIDLSADGEEIGEGLVDRGDVGLDGRRGDISELEVVDVERDEIVAGRGDGLEIEVRGAGIVAIGHGVAHDVDLVPIAVGGNGDARDMG